MNEIKGISGESMTHGVGLENPITLSVRLAFMYLFRWGSTFGLFWKVETCLTFKWKVAQSSGESITSFHLVYVPMLGLCYLRHSELF